MQINGGQLYSAVEYLSKVFDIKVQYSKFLWMSFNEGVVTLKACSDIFVGAKVQYNEPFKEKFEPFVVEISRLKNFLKNNKKSIEIQIDSGFVLFKGKGNLRLNMINEMDYAICSFEDNDNFTAKEVHVNFDTEIDACVFLESIEYNLKWVDNSTISPQYRDISINNYMSTRRYKHNVSCLNLGFERFGNIVYDSIIFADFIRILNSINSVKTLALELSENYTSFEVHATDLNITYFLKCRSLDGTHPIDVIYQTANQIIENNHGFGISKKKLQELVASGLGYSDKDDTAIFSIKDNVLKLSSNNDDYNYQIEDTVAQTQEGISLVFNLNLTALNDILNCLTDEETIILTDYSLQGVEVSKLVIFDDTSKMLYLFPTWN